MPHLASLSRLYLNFPPAASAAIINRKKRQKGERKVNINIRKMVRGVRAKRRSSWLIGSSGARFRG